MQFKLSNKRLSILVSALMGTTCVSLPAIEPERDAVRGVSGEAKPKEILQRACRYLWSKQSDDGAWRSETYGLLKSGQSLTPFVLFALSEVHKNIVNNPQQGISNAMNFLRKMGSEEGFHGRADPDLFDYPNYATSYALRCFLRYGDKNDRARIQSATSYLLNQQFNEKVGFHLDSVVYGGWGFGINRKPTIASFVDLAHTRRVLQALDEGKAIPEKTANRARRFLSLLQKDPQEKRSPIIPVTHWKKNVFVPPPYDGGFFSSPNVSYANKGRIAKDPRNGRPYYSSYATATCDGILSLLATGHSPEDAKVKDAARWLERNPGWSIPAGIPAKHREPWAESMIYYHLAVRAEVYARSSLPGNWRQTLARFLERKQRPDGSFLNPKGLLMKEDDPMLCTALAVTALGNIMKR